MSARDRPMLDRHSSCITNVYKLDTYAGAGSIQSCTSMRLGHVPADWRCGGLSIFPTFKLGNSRYHLYWVESTINQQFIYLFWMVARVRVVDWWLCLVLVKWLALKYESAVSVPAIQLSDNAGVLPDPSRYAQMVFHKAISVCNPSNITTHLYILPILVFCGSQQALYFLTNGRDQTEYRKYFSYVAKIGYIQWNNENKSRTRWYLTLSKEDMGCSIYLPSRVIIMKSRCFRIFAHSKKKKL